MELRQLRNFLAVAKARNFRRAAEAIHMAQPPLSVSIRKLEEELRLRLFERHPRGVTLTPAGEAALTLALEVEERIEALRSLATEPGEGNRGRLNVAFVTSATFAIVPAVVPAFRKRFPSVELRLREATTRDVLQGLRAGDVDIGLIRTPVYESQGLYLLPLVREHLVLAVPRNHRLAAQEGVPLEGLADEAFIMFDRMSNLRTYIVVNCEAAGFLPQVAEEVTHIYTMVALVESGMGVGLLSSSIEVERFPNVRCIPVTLRGSRIATGIALAARQDEPNVLARNFATVALSTAGGEGA